METHSSILAWRIPCTEESGRLQLTVLQRIVHDRSDLACTHTIRLWLTKSHTLSKKGEANVLLKLLG